MAGNGAALLGKSRHVDGAEALAFEVGRLAEDRGKRRTIVAVAVARELAGFCWAVANAD